MINKYSVTAVLRMLLIAVFPISGVTASPLMGNEPQPMVGEAAPLFTLNALDGSRHSLDELKGRYTVIHFATTWCPFCNAEAPHLEDLYQRYKGRGVAVLIIDVKEDQQLVARWASKFDLSFPVLLDSDGGVATQYAPEGVHPSLARDEVPLASNLIIDRDGTIRYYSLLNTTSFDPELTEVKAMLDRLIQKETVQ
ncbi:MAG: peroxiredoxin family protein [Ignavibacteria bacterium]|nr:peroxiredoxin family protein [Ignavibacteria bacterium]